MDENPKDPTQTGDSSAETNTPQTPNSSILEAIGKHPKAKLENTPQEASFKILLLAVVFGTFLIAIVLLLLAKNVSNPDAQPTPTPTPTPVPNQPTPTPTPAPRGQRYVAYIKNDPQSNVYVVEVVGRNVRKLTENSDDRVSYSLITWRSYDRMAYVQCGISTGGCQIIERSITSGEETIVVTNKQFPGGSVVHAIQYNNAGDAIAVYYENSDGRSFAVLFSEGRQIALKEFGRHTSREKTFMDEVSFSFSPDDEHVIVITTLLTPNADPKFPTLYLFNTESGSALFSLGSNTAIITQPHWIDNKNFYFEREDALHIKQIVTQGETVQIGANPKDIDFQTAYDKQYLGHDQIVYWTQSEDGRSTLGLYTISARRPRFTEVRPNFYKPKWYSDVLVAALETRERPPQDFTPTGRLMMVDVSSSSSYELESSGVVDFSIEPPQL